MYATYMSKRLQVLMDESEYGEIQNIAANKKLTVAEWVRQVLRDARENEPKINKAMKLEAIRAAYKNSFPTADIDKMLEEIESGYLS